MLKKVNLTVRVERRSLNRQLLNSFCGDCDEAEDDFFDDSWNGDLPSDGEPEKMELFSEGRLRTEEHRWALSYQESEITGMEGTTTQLSFDPQEPGLVTMLRTGNYTTALVFEQNKRHTCHYRTPYMTFRVCVYTRKLENHLTDPEGTLTVDYIIEILGAEAEHCTLEMQLLKP